MAYGPHNPNVKDQIEREEYPGDPVQEPGKKPDLPAIALNVNSHFQTFNPEQTEK